MNVNRIFLIGYMGSGKTTIGKQLAKELGLHFVDLDLFLENRFHKTISQIFTEKGEQDFRIMEHRALKEVISFENIVISTGGGVPCYYNNIELMNSAGITVYLKVSTSELALRLRSCKQSRPLLRDKNDEELYNFIAENISKREFFYNQANIIFDAEKLLTNTDIDNIISNLIKYLPTEFKS